MGQDIVGTRLIHREQRCSSFRWFRGVCHGPVKSRSLCVLQNTYDQITVRVQRSKELSGSSKQKTVSEQDKRRRTREHSNCSRLGLKSGGGKQRERSEERNEVDSDVIPLFSARTEVSHWQAACESGRVWLRLLQSGGYETCRVSYAVEPAEKQTSVALVVQMWRFSGCQRRPAGRASGW